MNLITNGFCSHWRTTKGSTWRIAAGVGMPGTEIFVHLAHISWLICTHKTSNTSKLVCKRYGHDVLWIQA
jgi:hypothetical protein